MKKQILILAMFTLALIFAGPKSYGQDINYLNVGTTDCPVPAVLNCAGASGSELSPLPGVTYTYTVNVVPGVTAPGYVQWFVTDESALINATGVIPGIMELNDGTSPYLLNATALAYNSTTNTASTIDISWKSFNGTANQVLLVAYVKGNGTPGCSDNIEVWRIEPTFAFRLEIAGMLPDGTVPPTGNASECLTPVQSAVYNGTNLTMDYGDNYVFFVVSAASFVHSWQPTFNVVSTGTAAGLGDLQWAYPSQAILAAGTWNAATDPVLAQDGTGAVGDAGECIIVRVHLDHGNVENDLLTTVTLTVDGIMRDVDNNNYTNPAYADLDNGANAGDPCRVGSYDSAVYELTPRPNITEVNPAAPSFEPKN